MRLIKIKRKKLLVNHIKMKKVIDRERIEIKDITMFLLLNKAQKNNVEQEKKKPDIGKSCCIILCNY